MQFPTLNISTREWNSQYHVMVDKSISCFCFYSLLPSQQFFSHIRTGLPGLNQYYAEDKVSSSRTQCSAFGDLFVLLMI